MNLWIRNFRQSSVGMAYPTSLSVDWGGRLGMKDSRWSHPHFWDLGAEYQQGFSTKCLVSFYIVFHFQLPCLSFFTWKENSEATKLEISRSLKILVHNHTGSLSSYSFGQTSHGFKEKGNRLHSLMAGVTQSHCKKVHEKGGVVVAICEIIQHKHGWMSF